MGESDGELVRSALRGDLGAFDRLVGRYQRQATAVAYRLLNHREDALEVVQDAFLKAYQKLSTLSERDRFGPWLLRIVSNLALNRRRSRALRRSASLEAIVEGSDGQGDNSPPDERAVGPDDAMSAQDVRSLLDRAIAELPEMQRKALTMFCIAQLPQKEIAEALGTSVEAVKWHVFTARRKIKEKLKDYI